LRSPYSPQYFLLSKSFRVVLPPVDPNFLLPFSFYVALVACKTLFCFLYMHPSFSIVCCGVSPSKATPLSRTFRPSPFLLPSPYLMHFPFFWSHSLSSTATLSIRRFFSLPSSLNGPPSPYHPSPPPSLFRGPRLLLESKSFTFELLLCSVGFPLLTPRKPA